MPAWPVMVCKFWLAMAISIVFSPVEGAAG